MKARRYITQYYRIQPTSAVDSKHIIRKKSRKLYEFKSYKPFLNFHNKHVLKSIHWTGDYGKVLLYAVRMIDTYMLTINGRSRLYPRVEDIYKALVSKGVFPASDQIAELFKNNEMIDLDSLALLSNLTCGHALMNSHADLCEIPAYEWIIEQSDVYIERLSKTSTCSYIPCLHEDKIVTELFLETRSLDEARIKQIRDAKFREFTSSYFPSQGAIQEILDDLEMYF